MNRDKFLIKGLAGKKKLKGTINVSGAKNAALKLIASTILFKNKVTLDNVPEIEDVNRMIELLEDIGVCVEKEEENSYSFVLKKIKTTHFSENISKHIRASIALTGPVLARFGKVSFPHPGGCVIGKRPIDLYMDGFRKMGADIKIKNDSYVVEAIGGKLRGATIFLRNQSVTAAETFMMAGVLAEGRTVIKNAPMEPEVVHLAEFLVSAGANIKGIGTTTITIDGGPMLFSDDKVHSVIPDRIEAGSFLILGALSAKELSIKKCNPQHLESLIETLRMVGVKMEIGESSIKVFGDAPVGGFDPVDIKTHEYPGFPTDLQAPMVVFLTQSSGESMVFETIFEGRLNYFESLVLVGADIKMMDPHRIIVNGKKALHGKTLESPDLRAGLAFVIAAIVATGNSTICSVYNIDRGYEKIEKRLKDIGVDITRIADDATN